MIPNRIRVCQPFSLFHSFSVQIAKKQVSFRQLIVKEWPCHKIQSNFNSPKTVQVFLWIATQDGLTRYDGRILRHTTIFQRQ